MSTSKLRPDSTPWATYSTNLLPVKSQHGDRAPCMSCAAAQATHASWFHHGSLNECDTLMERNFRRRTQHEFRHRDRVESSRSLCRKSLGIWRLSCIHRPRVTVPKVARSFPASDSSDRRNRPFRMRLLLIPYDDNHCAQRGRQGRQRSTGYLGQCTIWRGIRSSSFGFTSLRFSSTHSAAIFVTSTALAIHAVVFRHPFAQPGENMTDERISLLRPAIMHPFSIATPFHQTRAL